jgi:hypothetical protein
MQKTLKTEFSCPVCKKTTGESNQVLATAGELCCSKNSSHRWNDTMTFLNLGPVAEFKVMPLVAEQTDRTPFTIPVPINLKKQLEDKYGAKLYATVVAILNQMNEGTAMIVPNTDVERLVERLGAKFNNSSELVGVVYSKVCEADDARAERDNAVKDLKAYEGLSPGRVVVDLGPQMSAAQAKAVDAQMPLKMWVETQLRNAISENWF